MRIFINLIITAIIIESLLFYYNEIYAPANKAVIYFFFPDNFKDKKCLDKIWDKIGIRLGKNAIIQCKIKAIDKNGQIQELNKNTKVICDRIDMVDNIYKYKYTFRYKKEIYTYISNCPFDLLYNVHSDNKKSWKNLFERFHRKGSDIAAFKKTYKGLFDKIKENSIDTDSVSITWLKTISANYFENVGSNLPNSKLDTMFIYQTIYGIAYDDITPVMKATVGSLCNNCLIYIQKPKGIKVLDENFQVNTTLKKDTIQPYFDEKKIHETPFRFKGYTKDTKGNKFIKATFSKDEYLYNVNLKVNFYDDLLPIKPSNANYEKIAYDILNKQTISCDDIILALVYIDRQLYFNLLDNTDNPKRYREIISKLLNRVASCPVGKVGPQKEIKIARNPSSSKILLPDEIVRKYYSNLDLLLPAWCNYNFLQSKNTGIVRTNNLIKFPSGYNVLEGRYCLIVPNLKELLLTTDLSVLLNGYGMERIIIDLENEKTIEKRQDYESFFKEKENSNCNAAVFTTNDSYKEIARCSYSRENFNEEEIDVIAKGLREFNNLLIEENNLDSIGGKNVDLNQSSNDSKKVVVPVKIDLLGFEQRPIKKSFRYKFKFVNK